MKLSFTKLVLLGVFLEIVIFLVCYQLQPELEETFRYAARYSGRLSALVFLYGFYLYAVAFPKPLHENVALRNIIRLFAILHIIHFGFLATNIYLNEIPLIPVKLIGGALAYLMIVVAPFKIHQVKVPFQLTYFYYVTFVMIMTYIARAKGDFVGAEPFWFHYLALISFVSSAIVFGVMMRKASKK